MKIDVIGCGSAFSKQNNTSSIIVTDSKSNQLLIDCGPTVPRALWQRETDINRIQAIYFTHIHPDHCCGLPALLNQCNSFKRTQSLDIFCQPEQREALKSLCRLANWPNESLCFDVNWHDIKENFYWKGWDIKTANTQHAISNKAIRINTDHQGFFYSGDGRPTEMTKAIMIGADLGFQECASNIQLPEDSSHGDFFSCKNLIEETQITALGLYHCFDEYIEELHHLVQSTQGLFLSHDGLSVDLEDKLTINLLASSQQ